MYEYCAVVKNVVDGDTVDLIVDLGFGIKMDARFRLFGINAYELTSKDAKENELAKQGKQFLIDTILNKKVVINSHKDKHDKYGRYLATIFIDLNSHQPLMNVFDNVNNMLVEKGFAVKKDY